MSGKQLAIAAISKMPDESSLEDVQERLYVIEKVERADFGARRSDHLSSDAKGTRKIMARRRQRYRIVWTLEAADDLKEIHDYIAKNSATYAQRAIQKITASIEALRDFPRLGRMVPEFREPDVRDLIVYSYRVIYEVTDAHRRVELLAIIHGARDLYAAMRGRR